MLHGQCVLDDFLIGGFNPRWAEGSPADFLHKKVIKEIKKLPVGSFNPFEQYQSKWESSPNRGENKNKIDAFWMFLRFCVNPRVVFCAMTFMAC